MKTTYEIYPTMAGATASKNGNVHLLLEEGVGTTIKVELTPERATSLRRSMARVLDLAGVDPTGSYSMKELAETRSALKGGRVLADDAVIDIIDAYMRLIELVNEKAHA